METSFRFIDLFCGIGGFHQALSSLGGECVYACDINERCRNVYEKNYGIVPDGDITKVDEKDIPDHDLLCAGFPCQAFSIAGKREGFKDKTRGTLFMDICRILLQKQPKYALLENVKNLVGHDGGRTWETIRDALREVGYNVPDVPALISPHWIGVPQQRERVYIMCVRKDLPEIPDFYFNPSMKKECDVNSILQDDDEIEGLEHFKLSQDWIDYFENWNILYQSLKWEKTPTFTVVDEYMHTKEENFELWRDYSEGKFQRWKEILVEKNFQLYMKNKELVDKWRENSKDIVIWKGAKTRCDWQAGHYENLNIWNHILKIRQSGLRVKKFDNFPTLVVFRETPIIGPRKRYITPRECARLQSFPDTFILDTNIEEARKQFGNSVNVEVTKLFAKFLLGDEETRRNYSKNV